MKKVFIFSITLGIIFSLLLYLNYRKVKSEDDVTNLYFLQVSALSNLNGVSKLTKRLDNYIVIKESDELYHVYVGIIKNKDNFDKIKSLYQDKYDNIYLRERIVNCKSFFSVLDNYEILLSNADDISVIDGAFREILKKYNNCENKRNG